VRSDFLRLIPTLNIRREVNSYMFTLLSEAGRSFLRAFGGSLLILLPGVLTSPNLDGAFALAVSALIASIAAGLKAIQVFIPRLSFKSLLAGTRFALYYTVLDSFVRAFLASLITTLLGVWFAPDFVFSKAALVSLLIGAVTAAIRVVQGAGTRGDVPAPAKGVQAPIDTA
jgi:hypothetical protein